MVLLFAVIRSTGGRPGYKRNMIHPVRLVIFKVFMRHPHVYVQKGCGMSLYISGSFMNKYIDCGVINI